MKENWIKFEKSPFYKFIVSKEAKSKLKDIMIKYKEDKALEDKVAELASLILPEEMKKVWNSNAFSIKSAIYADYRKVSGASSYMLLNSEKLIK